MNTTVAPSTVSEVPTNRATSLPTVNTALLDMVMVYVEKSSDTSRACAPPEKSKAPLPIISPSITLPPSLISIVPFTLHVPDVLREKASFTTKVEPLVTDNKPWFT